MAMTLGARYKNSLVRKREVRRFGTCPNMARTRICCASSAKNPTVTSRDFFDPRTLSSNQHLVNPAITTKRAMPPFSPPLTPCCLLPNPSHCASTASSCLDSFPAIDLHDQPSPCVKNCVILNIWYHFMPSHYFFDFLYRCTISFTVQKYDWHRSCQQNSSVCAFIHELPSEGETNARQDPAHRNGQLIGAASCPSRSHGCGWRRRGSCHRV